tara:strand:+ start:288 stop:479 length:192 start_codon:yes stop_codon:yes gene_type:complete
MKKEGEKEFEVIFKEVISHRVLIYADNEETAKYKAIDDEGLPLRMSQVTEKNIIKITERQERE